MLKDMLIPLVCESNFSPRIVFKNICQLDGFPLPLLGYRLFYDLNLLLRQAIEFIDKLFDLAVGGLDLALKTPEKVAASFRSSRGSQFCSVGVEIVIQGS